MTDGRILFLYHKYVYSTVIFHGNMHPALNGKCMIQGMQEGILENLNDFYDFIDEFDEKHYRYREEMGEDVFEFPYLLSEENINMTDNWIDYVYIINQSGRSVEIAVKEGTLLLPDGAMGIIHFQSLGEMVF